MSIVLFYVTFIRDMSAMLAYISAITSNRTNAKLQVLIVFIISIQ